MTTAQDIIGDALVKTGVYSPGETPTDADMAQGLISLNNLIDQWASEYLYVTSGQDTTLTLVIAKATYTIGVTAGANIAQIRPVRITNGPGMATCTVAAAASPVDVVTSLEWNNIYSLSPGTGKPDVLFYDPQYPLGVFSVAPTPTAVGTLTCQAWIPFTSFADYATAYTFVPGMEDALKTNLALVLKPYFSDTQINPIIVAQAMRDKEMIRYSNLTSRAMIGRAAKQA